MTALNLGPKCQRCQTNEARCANAGGCCASCTHTVGADPVKRCAYRNVGIARISGGAAPYIALCDDCGQITSQQRLVSVVLTQLARMHGYESWLDFSRGQAA